MRSRLRSFVLEMIVPSWAVSVPMRRRLLHWCGVRASDSAYVRPGTRFISSDVTIGREALINFGCMIDAAWAPIEIGAEVFIAPQVTLTTASHEIGPASRRAGAYRKQPVHIGDGCWLGLGCVVLPGVTVAAGCIIAAGAVVTADTEPNGLYGGVPARRLRDLPLEGVAQPAHLR